MSPPSLLSVTSPRWGDQDPVTWLNERQSLGIEPGLKRVQALLTAFDDPHRCYATIHIAGTNGKGSVSTFIAEALRRSGHRTGMFTSPHLIDVAESIQVDGDPIRRSDLAAIIERLQPAVSRLDGAGLAPTFFELLTAVAFIHFREAGVDWAVVEAGMGGGLDSTNVVDPELTVITNVTYDHRAFLGKDLSAIASHKAGIIKPGVPLVTAASGEALAVIQDRSRHCRSPITVIGEDYLPVPAAGGLRLVTGRGETTYAVAAKGEHQLENAAVAVAACDVVRLAGVRIPQTVVHETLAVTTIPGRIETFHLNGTRVVIDGAHNLAGAKALGKYLRDVDRRYHLIVGFSEDKDWVGMLQQWIPFADRVTAVRIRTPRSLDPTLVASQVPDKVPFTTANGFSDAWNGVGKCDVVVAGSLFLVGETRSFLLSADPNNTDGSVSR